MAVFRSILTFIGASCMTSMSSGHAFNFEEIKMLNFAVEILDQPVVFSEKLEPLSVRMYNSAGQPYMCQLPDTASLLAESRPHRPSGEDGEQQDSDQTEDLSVSALLTGMTLGPCLQRTRDWWTYELCPMSEIKQYHMEAGQIVGKVEILGRFESDYDWSKDDGTSRNAKNRYHSQLYTNGSTCDLTGRSRSAEVRYVCEEGGGDALVRVDEPETCRYVLTVQTARICRHPRLAPPAGQRPHPVTCRPELGAAQLRQLTEARLARLRAEQRKLATRAAQNRPAELEGREEEEPVSDTRKPDEETVDWSQVRFLYESASEHLKKCSKLMESLIDSFVAVVADPDIVEDYDMGKLLDMKTRHAEMSTEFSQRSERLLGLLREAERSQQYQDLLVAMIDNDRLQRMMFEMMGEVTSEFERLWTLLYESVDVVDGTVVIRLAEMSATLHQLVNEMQKLNKKQKAIHSNMFETGSALFSGEDDRGPQLAEQDAEPSESEEDTDDDGITEQSADQTSEKSPAEGEEDSKGSRSRFDPRDQEESDPDPDPESEDVSTRKTKVRFSTLETSGLQKMLQVKEINKKQRAKIEKIVKQKLETVGLESNGPEIKVRFLTLPNVKKLDKTVEHTLTEEELEAFENALVTIMMGSQEAITEHEKQRQMADNYQYSFDAALRREQGSTLSTDTDETSTDREQQETVDLEKMFTLV